MSACPGIRSVPTEAGDAEERITEVTRVWDSHPLLISLSILLLSESRLPKVEAQSLTTADPPAGTGQWLTRC